MPEPLSLVVMISGRGSNLAHVITAAQSGRLNLRILGVISNRAEAGGLEHARAAAIPTRVLPHTDFTDRGAFDAALAKAIDHWHPELILMSGFMRMVTEQFATRYGPRMINQHPSLLPKYPGLHTYERVLRAGDREHGASVHFVTPDLDAGPVIAQIKIPVVPGDSPETLADRLQVHEHRLLENVLGLFCERRIEYADGVVLDGQRLNTPLQFEPAGT